MKKKKHLFLCRLFLWSAKKTYENLSSFRVKSIYINKNTELTELTHSDYSLNDLIIVKLIFLILSSKINFHLWIGFSFFFVIVLLVACWLFDIKCQRLRFSFVWLLCYVFIKHHWSYDRWLEKKRLHTKLHAKKSVCISLL